MHSNAIEERKRHLRLTDRQREIVVGLLLGDGHLESQDGGRTYRLKIEHSIAQRVYVDWLYEAFHDWVRTAPQRRSIVLQTTGRRYEKCWFNTLSVAPFRFYAQQFYRNGRKVVPKLIHRWLTPLALAIWYMDDGSVKSSGHSTVLFNTHAFERPDLIRLQRVLDRRYGIATTLRRQREGMQIYLLAETIETFRRLIEPHIHVSMQYKLPKVWLTRLPKR